MHTSDTATPHPTLHPQKIQNPDRTHRPGERQHEAHHVLLVLGFQHQPPDAATVQRVRVGVPPTNGVGPVRLLGYAANQLRPQQRHPPLQLFRTTSKMGIVSGEWNDCSLTEDDPPSQYGEF